MRILFLALFLPLFGIAFTQGSLDELISLTSQGGADPIALTDEGRAIFYTKDSIGSFDQEHDSSGARYFKYFPAQRGNGSVVGYRFANSISREEIEQKRLSPTRISFLQNQWSSLIFRTFEISSDARSLSTYQECWQTVLGQPHIQCALVNKSICDRVNRGGYDWDKNYRKDAQAYRKQMMDRFHAEALPENLNQKLSLSFLNYSVLNDYDHAPKELLLAFAGGVQMRLENVCKKFTWSEDSAIEKGFKH